MFDLIENEKSILVIDDKPVTQKLLIEFLSPKFVCDRADCVESSFDKIREKQYAVILWGLPLTNEACEEVISQIQMISPPTATILISEKDSAELAVKAFRSGAFDFILKPFQLKLIEQSVKRAFEHYETKLLKNRYQFHLEELAAARAAEVDKALEEVENSYRTTLKALVQALETRDFETHGHSERVVTFSLRLGHELGLDKDALRNLELGALLHDIGKIGVPDAILRKPAALNEDEWNKMKLHPQHGQKILRNITFLKGAAQLVAQHHEKWDGSGYPYGLRGEDIDLSARIFAVADAFDAMVSDRVYRKGRPYRDAVAELEKHAGTQFDPLVVEAFKNIPAEDWEILRERSITDKQEICSFQAIVAELIYSRRQFEMVH
ncbi:MAG TPA: HD domain-containing phosphohydrolase [Pyrinomonadaceae bacterium]|nr:HD domain-containing phosphohydrolase [Pyrinomonadaceae bacterium]